MLHAVPAFIQLVLRFLRVPTTGILAVLGMPIQWQHIMQAHLGCRVEYHGLFDLLLLLVRLGECSLTLNGAPRTYSANSLWRQETLSSIDLTSYLGITGAGFAAATAMAPVDVWATQVRPAPAATATALQTPPSVAELVDDIEKLKQQARQVLVI